MVYLGDNMCLVCTEWLKGNLTTKEAQRNLQEVRLITDEEIDHYWEVAIELMEDELSKT